ncbi:unnamed protein product [Ilex paraguariensis]|uniref:Uncharacterized protein n=1 Tax=Ilex paraguariensis TaxID=185542 RepID=A0ABC8TE69_9AQUA
MRDRMERLVVLPFSIGCVSESSVAVGTYQPKKQKVESNSALTRAKEGEESSSGMKMKNSLSFLALPKPNFSYGIHRLVRSFKSFSQRFGKWVISYSQMQCYVCHEEANHYSTGWIRLCYVAFVCFKDE